MTSLDVPVRVEFARDARTDLGIIAAGTPMLASPSVEGGWEVELSLPRVGVPSHLVAVPANKIRNGKKMLDILHSHHDYRFAREVLGWSHSDALRWIERGYKRSERQVLRWGFTAAEPGVAA